MDESELDRNKHVKDLSETMQVSAPQPDLMHNTLLTVGFSPCQTWEWMYGQTPEFTHAISGDTPGFGPIVSQSDDLTSRPAANQVPILVSCFQTININSRHGMITSAELTVPPRNAAQAAHARALVAGLTGDRYGSLDETEKKLAGMTGEKKQDCGALVQWLRAKM